MISFNDVDKTKVCKNCKNTASAKIKNKINYVF